MPKRTDAQAIREYHDKLAFARQLDGGWRRFPGYDPARDPKPAFLAMRVTQEERGEVQ